MPAPVAGLGRYYLKLVPTLLTLVAMIIFISLLTPHPTNAQSTNINVGLFSATQAPEIFITYPATDSVVNTEHITITGSATNTTDITVYVNGIQYSTTPIVGGSFSIPINLMPGTNTITIVASSHISSSTSTYQVIVTYLIETPPSNGESVPTVTPPSAQPRPNQINSGSYIEELKDSDGGDRSALDRIKDNLLPHIHSPGRKQTSTIDYVKPIGMWISLIFATLFMFVAITPSRYGLLKLVKGSSVMQVPGLSVAIRVAALILALIFATIIQT